MQTLWYFRFNRRRNLVIPLTVKIVPLEVQSFHLLLAHFFAFGIFSLIQPCAHFQASFVFGSCD